ncbi:MAG: MutS-related protein [Promethearchaeota archaeon]
MSIDDLSGLYGVGRKTREKLLEKFSSPAEAVEAIRGRDLDKFSRLGFEENFAVDLIRKVTTRGFKFLQTRDARQEYRKILELILQYPHTGGGRNLVKLIAPLNTLKAIERRSHQVLAAKKFVLGLTKAQRDSISKAFLEMDNDRGDWGGSVAVASAVVATDERSVLEEYGKRCRVHFFSDVGELAELFRVEPFIRVVTKRDITPDTGMEVFSPESSPLEILPEEVLEEFKGFERDLKLYLRLAEVVPGRFKGAGEVERVVTAMDAVDGGLSKLREVAVDWDDLRYQILEKVEKLSKRVISGSDLAQVAREVTGVEIPVPDLDIPTTDADAALQVGLERVLHEAEYVRAEKLARVLEKFLPKIASYRREVKMFDYWFALGRFAADYRLNLPHFSKDDSLFIREGRNLYLTAQHMRGVLTAVDPVDYILGKPPEPIPGVNGERLSLLTGANSGGKSCLLETVFQVVLLAYMGLLVPAEYSVIPPLDSIIYHRRHGSRSAGALESTLKKFVPAFVKAGQKKLVLVDEFEAITEPGGAARILIGLINLLIPRKVMGVFVTHLSREVANLTGPSVRVDSIVASGLDDDLNLLTNHQPLFGQAGRSTPEFIVQKLAAKSTNKSVQKAYATIKAALKQSRVVWQTRIDWYLDKLQVKKRVEEVPPSFRRDADSREQ